MRSRCGTRCLLQGHRCRRRKRRHRHTGQDGGQVDENTMVDEEHVIYCIVYPCLADMVGMHPILIKLGVSKQQELVISRSNFKISCRCLISANFPNINTCFAPLFQKTTTVGSREHQACRIEQREFRAPLQGLPHLKERRSMLLIIHFPSVTDSISFFFAVFFLSLSVSHYLSSQQN